MVSRLSEESLGAMMGDRMGAWSIMGLFLVGIKVGICCADARLARSSLRRAEVAMASVAVCDGLLDRNRGRWGISTWLSGDGDGDLAAGVAVADSAGIYKLLAKQTSRKQPRMLNSSDVRGDELLATGDDRERCMDIIMGP